AGNTHEAPTLLVAPRGHPSLGPVLPIERAAIVDHGRLSMVRVRILVLLLAAGCIPSIAAATSFHVRPDVGSDSNNGQSYSAALKTITCANAVMASGDICYLWPGTHSGIPNPTGTASGGRRY